MSEAEITKDNLESLWDEFNRENGWWWPIIFEDKYEGAKQFKEFLEKKLK